MAALRIVHNVERPGEVDPEFSVGEVVLAGRLFVKQTRRARTAVLYDKPFHFLDRWLIPLRDNAAIVALSLALSAIVVISFWPLMFPPTNFEKRLSDFQGIKRLLEQHRRDTGSYPITHEFVGLYSGGPGETPAWIPGLAPSYTRVLPRDPRKDDDPAHQYLFNSDGKDYKLIVHNPEDCAAVKVIRPELVDPVRDCRAYGFWTKGARDW
jgi:hypothetical protein